MLRSEEPEDERITASSRLYNFLFLGIALILVGVVILVLASVLSNTSSGSSGVVIFIGPIPIVFSSGPNAGFLILIGIILAVLSIVFFLVMKSRRIRSFKD